MIIYICSYIKLILKEMIVLCNYNFSGSVIIAIFIIIIIHFIQYFVQLSEINISINSLTILCTYQLPGSPAKTVI